ncbi:hypothetical protein RF11_03699 [Thelohanellus kitauei]|uniref:Uncharacterized protein n=1 Tax=Thelohanellus kitauei TaxID=669202 RepID=A0A0C2N8U1_THEKT|nr:hypothetical protein RF11_03699 [Thelohanellus kitauei]
MFVRANIHFNVQQFRDPSQHFLDTGYIKCRNLCESLITILNTESLITKVKDGQLSDVFDDFKGQSHNFINDDFIKSVFSGCELKLMNDYHELPPKITEHCEQKISKQVMAWCLLEFNEFHHLNINTTGYYLLLIRGEIRELFERIDKFDNSYTECEFTPIDSTSEPANLYFKTVFQALLKTLILIFELKFIFGDSDSKLHKLDYLLSL